MEQKQPIECELDQPALDRMALGERLREHQNRLCRVVAFRLDIRLRGRIDPEDLVQEVYLEACRNLRNFVPTGDSSLFLWLRGIAVNKLLELHRFHLGTLMRDARRDVSLFLPHPEDDTASALAMKIIGNGTRASEAAIRDESKRRLLEALNQLDPIDREVLALRHFEQLNSRETGQLLGIAERAASKRYLRALSRLRSIVETLPSGLAGFL